MFVLIAMIAWLAVGVYMMLEAPKSVVKSAPQNWLVRTATFILGIIVMPFFIVTLVLGRFDRNPIN